eukprot:1798402-Rhodomonas_salina.1
MARERGRAQTGATEVRGAGGARGRGGATEASDAIATGTAAAASEFDGEWVDGYLAANSEKLLEQGVAPQERCWQPARPQSVRHGNSKLCRQVCTSNTSLSRSINSRTCTD